MTEQLTRLIDALDRIAAALENLSLTSHSDETPQGISASGATLKPPIKIKVPMQRAATKITLSRRK